MKKFVPTEKLSKRAKKELAAARRKTWNVVPVSRKIESKKHYDRKKPYDRHDDYGTGLCFLDEKTGAGRLCFLCI